MALLFSWTTLSKTLIHSRHMTNVVSCVILVSNWEQFKMTYLLWIGRARIESEIHCTFFVSEKLPFIAKKTAQIFFEGSSCQSCAAVMRLHEIYEMKSVCNTEQWIWRIWCPGRKSSFSWPGPVDTWCTRLKKGLPKRIILSTKALINIYRGELETVRDLAVLNGPNISIYNKKIFEILRQAQNLIFAIKVERQAFAKVGYLKSTLWKAQKWLSEWEK